MKYKKLGTGFVVLVMLLPSIMVMSAAGFSETPICTDPAGDHGGSPDFTDILQVWVDNDATYLKFKFKVNGSWDAAQWPYFCVFISTDNATGVAQAGFMVDYYIVLSEYS